MAEKTKIGVAHPAERLADGFDEMFYLLSASQEKFDVDRFRESVGPKAKSREAYGITVAPKDPRTGDYHVNASWYIEKGEINLRIEYKNGPKEHESDEREPYAEGFMKWIGQFFKYETAEAHIHARFEYPLEQRQSTFPLPLKTSLAHDAEIDGIALKLPPKPQGVSRVRLTQGKKNWYVEVIADRRVTFEAFTPYTEVQALMSVVDTLIEERTP